jgi:Co/Zn/Cd efflux system component
MGELQKTEFNMPEHSHHHDHDHHHGHACASASIQAPASGKFRRALWIALVVNLAMFFVEIGAGWQAKSVSLLADAIDFAGDAGNYAISLVVLGMAATWRSRSALWKGWAMVAFGIAVAAKALWNIAQGAVPEALTMGAIGFLALAANVGVALLLYAYRNGDANMRSVWLCTRNDAIGNAVVMVAALGVFGTGTLWPDVAAAALMATLAIHSGTRVIRQARGELEGHAAAVH